MKTKKKITLHDRPTDPRDLVKQTRVLERTSKSLRLAAADILVARMCLWEGPRKFPRAFRLLAGAVATCERVKLMIKR